MNAYLLLGIAILAEVTGTTFMKQSEGFTRLFPSIVTLVFYAVAFYCLSHTLQYMPTGIAYAIWSGAGIVLISIVAWLFNGQKLDGAAIGGITLICAGVLIINLFSKSMSH